MRLEKEQIAELTQDYLKGLSLNGLHRKYGISKQAVRGLLIRHKVYVYPPIKAFVRKYSLDEDIFQELKNEHAYWLGFLWADGSITKEGSLSISLAAKDEKILKDFLYFIRGTHPIKPFMNNGYPAVRLVIYSPKLVDSLRSLKYSRLKKDRKELPPIKLTCMPHFIRGYFDGDGGFDIIQIKNHAKLRGFFTGYPEILGKIRDILNTSTHMDIRPSRKFKHSPITHSLMWKGNQKCLKFYRYIYASNPSFFMIRKKELAERVLSKYLTSP